MVPHLTTALTGPLEDIEKHILDAQPKIEQWFRVQWVERTPPFYASVDLRNSGFKLAPVDTNLFPGGFNNLNPDFFPLCVQAAQAAVERICPDARRVLLVPESHTRNTFYLQSVAILARILRQAGLEVRIGTLIPEITGPTPLTLATGDEILLEPMRRDDRRVKLADYNPCMILLNNDLSGGVPPLLENAEQPVIPALSAGWTTRRKSRHFAHYDRVTHDFSRLVGIDPWLVNPFFATCGEINFKERKGEQCLAAHVDELLDQIRAKYAEYDITEEPFVIVKSDTGTYGMAIMTVKDASEVHHLNRDARKKMATGKEGLPTTEVIIQEGVYTFESINDAVAEPVVYMMDRHVVGGFYRVHTGRGRDENLNSPGMHFIPLAFEIHGAYPDTGASPDAPVNRFYTYGVVARLALLAAAMELELG